MVLHVLYLIFNEGYTASSGADLQRPELVAEAIRLTRALHRALPDDGEVAVHVDAGSAADTDWAQITALYRLLEHLAPNPMVTLNRAIAVAMTDSPEAGLTLLGTLENDSRMARHHRLIATRAHLLEMAGDPTGAREAYKLAAQRTTSIPEQRYLDKRAHRLR